MGAVRAAVGFTGMWVVALLVSGVIALAILLVVGPLVGGERESQHQGEALPYDPNPVHQR